jgi:hypothetical protein
MPDGITKALGVSCARQLHLLRDVFAREPLDERRDHG